MSIYYSYPLNESCLYRSCLPLLGILLPIQVLFTPCHRSAMLPLRFPLPVSRLPSLFGNWMAMKSWPRDFRTDLRILTLLRWLQSLTMEVILSTAFGVKGETQTVENDPITELAKKAMAAHPLVGIMCKEVLLLFLYFNCYFFQIQGVHKIIISGILFNIYYQLTRKGRTLICNFCYAYIFNLEFCLC